jgi:hypothetical protein
MSERMAKRGDGGPCFEGRMKISAGSVFGGISSDENLRSGG